MSGWRKGAIVLGSCMALAGLGLVYVSGNPVILLVGALVVLTTILDPVYGKRGTAPKGAQWQATDERFIDHETGQLVTVWFDERSGERRYVSPGELPTPPA